MKIKAFAVEEWMNKYEDGAKYNIAETCVDSVSLDELFALTGEDKEAFLADFCAKRLTYGDILGKPEFIEGICGLYKTLKPENIVSTHGAAGANYHVFSSLVEPGDRVISIMPTYQQLYSIPESLGAALAIMQLKPENGYHVDLEELRALATPGTHLSCIGADMSGKEEVEPSLCAKARVFGDDAAQCFAVGECEIPHALGMLGALTAEIGEVITGAASGRTGAEDITLFDSTGIALQDIACSCALLTAAEKAGLGTAVEL